MSVNRLKELRERAGLSMQGLAALIGTSAPQINKLEKGERRMTIDWMSRLAKGLGVEPKDLLPVDAPARTPPARTRPAPQSVSDPQDLISVRSAARGGDEQEMFLRDGPIDFIQRPPSLHHVRDAYSIYMVGESMSPRFRPGQILHINPYKPPQSGAGVVITRLDDAVLIKEFVRRSPTTLYVRQYNPDCVLELNLADIRDIHTVVGLDEP